MRFLTTFLISTIGILPIQIFAQFDRILTDPVQTNPSYVGSTSGHRIILSSTEQSYRNKNLSYDFFSPKLKGGWGICFSNGTFFNNQLTSSIAYSPKLTLRNSNVSFSPGVGFSYKKNSYSDIYWMDINSKIKDSYQLNTSINLNSKKVLIGFSVNINPISKIVNYQLECALKLDKRKENKLSSTLYLSTKLFTTHNPYHTFSYLSYYDTLMYQYTQTSYKNQVDMYVSYFITKGKFNFGLSRNFTIHHKIEGVSASSSLYFYYYSLNPNALSRTQLHFGFKTKNIQFTTSGILSSISNHNYQGFHLRNIRVNAALIYTFKRKE